jgi:hypothetical protein
MTVVVTPLPILNVLKLIRVRVWDVLVMEDFVLVSLGDLRHQVPLLVYFAHLDNR